MREKKILEAEHISVSFRMYDRGLSQYDLHIISDLSVEVHEGEIMVIVGASGSGQSVLAHAILGILPGNAIVGGTPVRHLPGSPDEGGEGGPGPDGDGGTAAGGVCALWLEGAGCRHVPP